MKFAFLDDHLSGSLDWYRQKRTQLQQGGGGVTSVMGTRRAGRRAGNPLCGDRQYQPDLGGRACSTPPSRGPTTDLQYIPARTAGVSPQEGFGGTYVVYNFSTLPGQGGNYEDTLVPHAVISPYLT